MLELLQWFLRAYGSIGGFSSPAPQSMRIREWIYAKDNGNGTFTDHGINSIPVDVPLVILGRLDGNLGSGKIFGRLRTGVLLRELTEATSVNITIGTKSYNFKIEFPNTADNMVIPPRVAFPMSNPGATFTSTIFLCDGPSATLTNQTERNDYAAKHAIELRSSEELKFVNVG